jgi:hypothetical protein
MEHTHPCYHQANGPGPVSAFTEAYTPIVHPWLMALKLAQWKSEYLKYRGCIVNADILKTNASLFKSSFPTE